MSYLLTQTCIDLDADLSAAQFAVLVVLCRFADDQGGNCYPTTETLAARSHLCVKSVRRVIADLTQAGWISTSQAPGGVRHFTVNAAKIHEHASHDQEGGEDVQGGELLTPRAKVQGGELFTGEGVNFLPGRGCKSARGGGELFTPDKNKDKNNKDKNKEENNPIATSSALDAQTTSEVSSQTPKKPLGGMAATHPLDVDALPDDWREYCEAVRPDLDAETIFHDFRFYWVTGKGQGTRRSTKGWASTWQNWVRRSKTATGAARAKRNEPERFSDPDYYANSVNPDGTFNWNI